jgi:hypothetical protein
MSSEENFRRLGLSIIALEEKMEEIKTYAQEMVRDKSKFDPDVLMNISNRLVSAAYELNQSYENYKRVRPNINIKENRSSTFCGPGTSLIP